MASLQEAYLEKLFATARANMELIGKNMPQFHQAVSRESLDVSVDITVDGDVTIHLGDGRSLSPILLQEHVEKELNLFADPGTRRQFLAFLGATEPPMPEGYAYEEILQQHYTAMAWKYPDKIKRHFEQHYASRQGVLDFPDFAGRIPLLLVFGMGLGEHVVRLVENYDIGQMIIIEHDLRLLKASVFFADYVRLSRTAARKGTSIGFLIDDDPEIIISQLKLNIQRKWPPYLIHGAAILHSVPADEFNHEIRRVLVDGLWDMYFSWGYYDDELSSIIHTLRNVERKVPSGTGIAQVPGDAVAVVVGSGPSLDGLLPLLRRYRDNLVIFSCGTSIAPLVHGGIIPDFHVEKERPYLTYEVLVAAVDPAILKQVTLLTLNCVHPDVVDLFKDTYMVWKAGDIGSAMVKPYLPTPMIYFSSQPTVTYAAAEIALKFGFKRMYLAGVDLGFKSRDQHHASNTPYTQEMPENQKLKKLLASLVEKDTWPVPGNFGGEVLTNNVLDATRRAFEEDLRVDRGYVRVFNLNAGALIKGALPLQPDDCVIDSTPEARQAAISRLLSNFRVVDLPDCLALVAPILGSFQVYLDILRDMQAREMHSKADVVDMLATLYRRVYIEHSIRQPGYSMVRGTLLQLSAYLYQFLSIIGDEGEAVAKARYDLSVMHEFLVEGEAILAGVCENLHGFVQHASQRGR